MVYLFFKTVHLASIYKGLYVGNINCASSLKWLDDYNIELLISLVPNSVMRDGMEKVAVPMPDTNEASGVLVAIFENTVYSLLSKAVDNNKNVMIHCEMGRSRYLDPPFYLSCFFCCACTQFIFLLLLTPLILVPWRWRFFLH